MARGNFTNHPTRDPEERFWENVSCEPMSGCWLWTAGLNTAGYGVFHVGGKGKRQLAHRWSYKHFIGPIPECTEPDHLCRLRCCVNPRHLEVVTHAVNVARGESGKYQLDKTHCPQGHPYEGDNLYLIEITVNGKKYMNRQCRACNKERSAKRRARKCTLGADLHNNLALT